MSGLEFIEAGWRNFQSYGNNLTTLSLKFDKPTVIIGRNLDQSSEGNIDSNGAGKTTILNVLSWICFDETITGIKKDKLINWVNEKNMEGFVTFKKNGVYYKIERYRKFAKKGGDGARIYESDTGVFDESTKEKAESGIRQINDQILEILGIPFDVFSRVVLLSSTTDSFFSLPATSAAGKACQRDILEELFGYTEISSKSEILKKKITDDKKERDRLFDLNKQILEEAERLKTQVEFAQTQHDVWVNSHDVEIRNLKAEIQKQLLINFEEEKVILDQINKLELKIQEKLITVREKELVVNNAIKSKQLFDDWESKKTNDIDIIKKNIEKYSKINFDKEIEAHKIVTEKAQELTILEHESYDYSKYIKGKEEKVKSNNIELVELAHNKCPYCKQDFKDVSVKVDALIVDNEVLVKEIESVTVTLNATDTSIITLKGLIKDNKSVLIFGTLNEALSKKAEAESLRNRFQEKLDESNPHIVQNVEDNSEEIIELKEAVSIFKTKIDKFKCVQLFPTERELVSAETKLQSNQQSLKNLEEQTNPHIATLNKLTNTQLPVNKNIEIEELRDEIEHSEFLYKLFTKKDSFIRKALLNKNLPYLNGRLKHYLSKTGLTYKVVITEDMSAAISSYNTQIDYNNLSKGQKARIDLATSFALRDVLQTRHQKVNLCILDEYLDSGLSGVGVDYAIKMLKEIVKEEKISMFIISHNERLAPNFDSKVEIELNNKFSNIVKSDIPFTSQ